MAVHAWLFLLGRTAVQATAAVIGPMRSRQSLLGGTAWRTWHSELKGFQRQDAGLPPHTSFQSQTGQLLRYQQQGCHQGSPPHLILQQLQ